MKKTGLFQLIIFIICGAMCAFALGSCTQAGPEDLDIEALAHKLGTEIVYDDELVRLSDDMVKKVYVFSADQLVVWAGSGATAEKIIVGQAESAAAAKRLEEEFKNYLDAEIKRYENYVPAELVRLDDAVVMRSGRYVAYCVTADYRVAEEIIKLAFLR